MSRTEPKRDLVRIQWSPGGPALLLSFVGGMVDSVGYLNLGHLFIGFMSGNSIKLGIHLGLGQWHEALRFLLPIVLFLSGIALGGVLYEMVSRGRVRSPVAVLLGIEALLLAGYICCGPWLMPAGRLAAPREFSWGLVLLVTLLTLAMGLQTAALQHVGSHSVHTTFITGMLTNLARQLARALMRSNNENDGATPQAPQLAWSWLLAALWIVYVAGATAGVLGLRLISVRVLVIPLFLLILLIALEITGRRSTATPARH